MNSVKLRAVVTSSGSGELTRHVGSCQGGAWAIMYDICSN